MYDTPHKLSPIKELLFNPQMLAMHMEDDTPRATLIDTSTSFLLDKFLSFLDRSVRINERSYLATVFGNAAKLSEDVIKRTAIAQCAVYEGDEFFHLDKKDVVSNLTFKDNRSPGATGERRVYYGTIFVRFKDAREGNHFKVRGVCEIVDVITNKNGREERNISIKEFRYTKSGKWNMFRGLTPRLRAHIETL